PRWRAVEEQSEAFLTGGECGISARFARFCLRFRMWVPGRPVFWRKGHVPEYWIGQHELHSYLRMIALMPVNVRDNALQRAFCLDVRQSEPLSSVHLRRHENQCTVGTDRQCLSLFFKRRS